MINSSVKTELESRIAQREAVVAVVGLGYVGLPLATVFANGGFQVIGIDSDPGRVAAINSGVSYIQDVPSSLLERLTDDNTNGDNTIIAASAGKKIAVWAIVIVSDGTTDVRWEDGAGTPLTGQVPLQVREGYSISAGGMVPLLLCSSNTLLNLELTATVLVHGWVSYSLIDD